MTRPYVLLSCAASVDGYSDDATGTRLLLSNDEDFDRVDEVRASCDAILVGANTIRRDNPRLLIRSRDRQQQRIERGLPAHPMKVTLTRHGDLDPGAQFFTAGDSGKLVYATSPTIGATRARFDDAATVIDAGDPLDLNAVLADLADRKVGRLMVEGGATVHTQFLTAGLADELHLVVAPLLVGDPAAPRFVNPGRFPQGPANRMTLAAARQIGDLVLLRYLLAGAPVTEPVTGPITGQPSPEDRRWLTEAAALAHRCPPSTTAFSVGAVIVGMTGDVLATGYSREKDPHDHAEEAALAKLDSHDPRLRTSTIYSSLEPCSIRASRPRSCTQLVLAAGIPRVVFAWREPSIFVDCDGAETLRSAGREVIEVPQLAHLVREVNAHLLNEPR